MTIIKITEKEVKLEGELRKERVTPFGTSAHIPFNKKHTGKVVNVIIPENSTYVWLISKKERNNLLRIAKKNIEKQNGKLEYYRLNLINGLEKEEFDLESLIKILDFVSDIHLVDKIKRLYNIK